MVLSFRLELVDEDGSPEHIEEPRESGAFSCSWITVAVGSPNSQARSVHNFHAFHSRLRSAREGRMDKPPPSRRSRWRPEAKNPRRAVLLGGSPLSEANRVPSVLLHGSFSS